jgi:hypothetical protein
MKIITLYARLIWAKLTRNPIAALLIRKEILMADFTALDADIDTVVAKVVNDAAAAKAAADAVEASTQASIDAARAKLAPAIAAS